MQARPRAILVRIGSATAPLAPFDEPAKSLPLLDVPLHEHQAREAERAGLELVEIAPGAPAPEGTRAAIGPDLVFTAEALTALLGAADRAGSPVRAGVKRGTALFDFVGPLVPGARLDEDLPLPFAAGALAGRPMTLELVDALPLAVVCDEEGSEDVRVAPHGPPPHVLRVPRVSRLAGRLCHWLHLLNLNQALLVHERARRGALGAKNALLGSVKRHPTALVEGSILSEGVEIEHAASVIDSFLGEGVKIGDHAIFHGCVIGKGCHTLIDTHMRRVVALPGSTLSNLGVEDLLVGRDVFITTAVAYFPRAPGENVVVDGVDSRRPVLSGAIGNRCILGARALFQSGLAVPSGTVIVMRPDEGATKLDDAGLARASMRRGDLREDF